MSFMKNSRRWHLYENEPTPHFTYDIIYLFIFCSRYSRLKRNFVNLNESSFSWCSKIKNSWKTVDVNCLQLQFKKKWKSFTEKKLYSFELCKSFISCCIYKILLARCVSVFQQMRELIFYINFNFRAMFINWHGKAIRLFK